MSVLPVAAAAAAVAVVCVPEAAAAPVRPAWRQATDTRTQTDAKRSAAATATGYHRAHLHAGRHTNKQSGMNENYVMCMCAYPLPPTAARAIECRWLCARRADTRADYAATERQTTPTAQRLPQAQARSHCRRSHRAAAAAALPAADTAVAAVDRGVVAARACCCAMAIRMHVPNMTKQNTSLQTEDRETDADRHTERRPYNNIHEEMNT